MDKGTGSVVPLLPTEALKGLLGAAPQKPGGAQ